MKKLFIMAILVVAGSTSMNAQGLDFGVKAGANFAKLDGDDISGDNLTSFHVGALLEVNVFENFSVQPEVLYSSQGTKIEDEDIKLDYLSVPVLAKFYLISDKLSLEAGPQFSFLVNDNIEEQFEAETFDFAVVGGLAFDVTSNIFVQARYVTGLTDTSKDAKITNQVIQLSVGLKF
ncbi:porin family protein [Flavobacterium soli]|uniref:porin family protein n=1 Tax=Flavobacterium soli TaxID=344881 RepID=UPI000479A2BF|nr:porin family protein [Flavobacterium soli]